MKSLILAGTKKGLFLLTSNDRQKWELHGPFFKGKEVNHAVYDNRLQRIFATSNDPWFGSEIVSSADLGQTWDSASRQPAFPENSGLKMERIWHIRPGHPSKPKLLFAGVSPAALFRSEDGGQTWDEVSTLTEHPTRKEWNPGGGGLCLHSIVLDGARPERIFVGISAVGVFRSDDSGQTWKTANRGTRAEFLPNKLPEYGQCVHKLLNASGDDLLFQQNHCGVYRSADGGESWTEITNGLPSDFGFPLALHPRDPQTLFVIPLQGGEFRCPPEGKLRVYRSRDGGGSWSALTNGLPQENAFCGIYREGMCTDKSSPAGIYFGTNIGQIYFSRDEGDSWNVIQEHLPPVYSVETAEIP